MEFQGFMLRVGQLLDEYAGREELPTHFKEECRRARGALDLVRAVSDEAGVGHHHIREDHPIFRDPVFHGVYMKIKGNGKVLTR